MRVIYAGPEMLDTPESVSEREYPYNYSTEEYENDLEMNDVYAGPLEME